MTAQERLQVDSLKGGLRPAFESTNANKLVLGTALLELAHEYLDIDKQVTNEKSSIKNTQP